MISTSFSASNSVKGARDATHKPDTLVPFILRGQETRTGDLLYRNRDGSLQFLYPDPLKLQRDFAHVSVSEIIDFLAEAGKAMSLDNTRMQQAYLFSQPFSALTASILKGSYELIPAVFSKLALRAMVENEIGSRFLDGWVEMPYADKVACRRAYGTRILHFISGNVPVVAALSIARAALIKADNIIKVTPNDPFTAWAILRAMIDVDPNHPVTKHFSVVYWHDLPDFEHDLIQPRYLEKLISWGGAQGGSNSTLNHGSFGTMGIALLELGPKFSIAILGAQAFCSGNEIDRVASLTARDSGAFNMESCGATRYHFIHATPDQARQYAQRLYHYMQRQDPVLSTAPKDFPLELHESWKSS